MTKRRALSAATRDTNTPETDLLPEVWHLVTDINGIEFELLAPCPLTAIDAFNDGKGEVVRKLANLNASVAQYSEYPEDQLAYEGMHKSALLLGEKLLQQPAGAYAEIGDNWWWVSPCKDRLEVVCSPNQSFEDPANGTVFLVHEFEGQGVDELKAIGKSLDGWIENPITKFGDQKQMDALTHYWTAPSDSLPNHRFM